MSTTEGPAPAAAMTTQSGFVHLHLHSEYSLLDGGNTIDRLLARCKELGMSAVAVTDHGNLYGAMEFYSKAKAAGIKPILGIEAYVAPESRLKKEQTGIADGGFHLVLLAENLAGWRNLVKLSSDSFINGFYYKPRMDKETLAQWRDGLIAINGHVGSSIAHHLMQYVQTSNEAHYRAALDEARWHADTFGVNECGEPRFFIELQRHDVIEQQRINPHLLRLARELNLPLVCDNDAHFLLETDWDHHDSLCCISMAKAKDDRSRLIYSRDLYVKSPEQMRELFTDLPEAIENTLRIAERCNVELSFGANVPVVRVVHPGVKPEYDPAKHGPDATAWFAKYCASFQLMPFDATRDDHGGTAVSAARTSNEMNAERAGGTSAPPMPIADQLKAECDRALRDLSEAGLIWRYGADGITPAIRARLDRELKILADKSISAYFLIVWDFVNWARQRGIPANARGSGVGTMVGYVLGLSNACPERYGLLFERFTDPDRSEYPDIDIDMCQDGRADVINYVRGKYGHVAQIITFGRLKAKAAIKDVARIMGLTPGEGQRLANLIPEELHITIDGALEREPDLKKEYESNQMTRRIIDTARALENHARHAGVHAAGVVIATQPLDELVPLCKTSGTDDVVTQWDGPTCEKVGLLKMDFLGLRTLSTIELCKKLIRATLSDDAIWNAMPTPPPFEGGGGGVGEGTRFLRTDASRQASQSHPHPNPLPQGRGGQACAHPLDLDRLSFDDQRVLALFRRGDCSGVFQFESGGMRKLLVEMQPDRLEDLIAANALYRPGPMDLIPAYNKRKHGQERVPRIHEIVDRYTDETYGIMVYQEQVMQILHGLGDIPLRTAYSLIKAISKKKQKDIDALRPTFIEGAKGKGLTVARADDLFDLILKFAGYGFNKSHSTGYAIIAYQTAYLKTYFPNHYMAAVLTYESAARKVEDWAGYLQDCRRTIFPDHSDAKPHVGVEVRPPDINLSQADFSVAYMSDELRDNVHGHVRFGLNAIKGIPGAAVSAILAERDKGGPFTSIFDFCERVDPKAVQRATIEGLVKCGALDSLHGLAQRAAMFDAIPDAIAAGQRAAEDRRSGQMNFFAAAAIASPAAKVEMRLPTVKPWELLESLNGEKETLGFHVSGHPLDPHASTLREFCTTMAAQARELAHDTPVRLGGLITRVRPTFVKTGRSAGQRMAIITLQDLTGSIDGVVFSDAFAKCGHMLVDNTIVVVTGRLDRNRGEPNIIAEKVIPIGEAAQQLAGRIEIDVVEQPDDPAIAELLHMLTGVLRQSSATGNGGAAAEVYLNLFTGGRRITLRSRSMRAVADARLLSQLHELVGPERVRIAAGALQLQPRGSGRPWERRGERAPIEVETVEA